MLHSVLSDGFLMYNGFEEVLKARKNLVNICKTYIFRDERNGYEDIIFSSS